MSTNATARRAAARSREQREAIEAAVERALHPARAAEQDPPVVQGRSASSDVVVVRGNVFPPALLPSEVGGPVVELAPATPVLPASTGPTATVRAEPVVDKRSSTTSATPHPPASTSARLGVRRRAEAAAPREYLEGATPHARAVAADALAAGDVRRAGAMAHSSVANAARDRRVAAAPRPAPSRAPVHVAPSAQAAEARRQDGTAACPTPGADAAERAEAPSEARGDNLSGPPSSTGLEEAGGDGPRRRGKGKVWNVEERVALAKAYTVATLNSVAGADQVGDDFWLAVFKGFVEQTPPDLPLHKKVGRWGDRPPLAAKTEFLRNVGPGSQRYAHFYFVARSDALTGNLDEEGVKRAARALYLATSAYDAVRKDCDEEEALASAGKAMPERRARMAPENWQPCWEELRKLDKWSGAAADPDISAAFPRGDDEDSDDNTTRRTGKRHPLQENPIGTKAAKKQASMKRKDAGKEDELAKAIAASNEAIATMVSSMSKRAAAAEAAQRAEERRTAAEYFDREDVRDTPEAKEFRASLHEEMVLLGRSALSASRERRLACDAGSTEQHGPRVAGAPESSSSGQGVLGRHARVGSGSRGANAMATKRQMAVERRRVIDLTLSSLSQDRTDHAEGALPSRRNATERPGGETSEGRGSDAAIDDIVVRVLDGESSELEQ